MVATGCDTLIAFAIVLDVGRWVRVRRQCDLAALGGLVPLLTCSSIGGQWQGVEFLAETSKIVELPALGAHEFGAMRLTPNKDLNHLLARRSLWTLLYLGSGPCPPGMRRS